MAIHFLLNSWRHHQLDDDDDEPNLYIGNGWNSPNIHPFKTGCLVRVPGVNRGTLSETNMT